MPLECRSKCLQAVFFDDVSKAERGRAMRRQLTLIGFGFIPLLVGWGINIVLASVEMSALSWSVLQLLMLPLWFLVGYRLYRKGDVPLKNALLLNIPALAAFILVAVQLLVLEHWWSGLPGILTQAFFAPFFLPAGTFIALVGGGLFTLFLISFVIMFALAWLGGAARKIKLERSGHK